MDSIYYFLKITKCGNEKLFFTYVLDLLHAHAPTPNAILQKNYVWFGKWFLVLLHPRAHLLSFTSFSWGEATRTLLSISVCVLTYQIKNNITELKKDLISGDIALTAIFFLKTLQNIKNEMPISHKFDLHFCHKHIMINFLSGLHDVYSAIYFLLVLKLENLLISWIFLTKRISL